MLRAGLLIGLFPAVIAAQTDTLPVTAADSAVARARALVTEGSEVEGLRVLDSILRASTPDSVIYSEALYWRAALSPTAADAERGYRRLLIETPLAPRAEDATLQLANLLQARGDRRGASDYLQRFMLSYSDSPSRPRVALTLVRLLFEQGPQQQARACEALRMGRDAIPEESLELRNQLEYYEPRCIAGLAPATPTSPDSATGRPAADSASRRAGAPGRAPPTAAAGAAATAYYSVQIAAYNTREPAVSLVNSLVERGIEARVDGTSAPFRVRVGKYTTRADAVKAATSLKAQGHNGFITLVQAGK